MKVDLRWTVPQNAQLWLRWQKAIKVGNGSVTLKNATFFGPVLSDYVALEEQGHILLDLTKHLIVITPEPYLVKLSWKGIATQDNSKVVFKEATLEDVQLGYLNKLKNSDMILLDCSGHTWENESKGKYLAAYQALVYSDLMEPYDFSR